ncbi:MAG: terminase small subunit [Aggregatilineales bacterium]
MTGKKILNLTARQRVFVERYVISWNASDAARRAGYSERTAKSQGSRLLKHPAVASAIGVRLEQLHMTADEALARLADHARGSMESFVNESGAVDLTRAARDGKLHLIKRVKNTTFRNHRDNSITESVEIELYDSQQALALIGRNQRLFTEQVDVHHDWRAEASAVGIDAEQLLGKAIAELRASLAAKQLPPGNTVPGNTVDAIIISEPTPAKVVVDEKVRS